MTIPNQKVGSGGLPALVTVGTVTVDPSVGFSTLDSSNHAVPDQDLTPATGIRYVGIKVTIPTPATLSGDTALFGRAAGGTGDGWDAWVTTSGTIRFDGKGLGGVVTRPAAAIAISAGTYWIFLPLEPRRLADGGVGGSLAHVVAGTRTLSSIAVQIPSFNYVDSDDHQLGYAGVKGIDGSELTFWAVGLWDFGDNPAGSVLQDIGEETDRHESDLIWFYDREAEAAVEEPCDPYIPGTHWLWLLEIEVQGRRLAYCTEPVEPVGGPEFKSGLGPMVIDRSPDLSSVSFTVDNGEDWPELYKLGTVMELSPVKISLWPKGCVYSAAIPILDGELHDLEFGALGQDRTLVGTIRTRPPQPQLWPPQEWVVDATTWDDDGVPSSIAPAVKGSTYPIPIGYPGTGDTDAAEGEPAVPALLVYYDGTIFSGNNFAVVGPADELDATKVELIRTDESNFDSGVQRAEVTLTTQVDQLGKSLAAVEFPSWWTPNFVDTATSGAGTITTEYTIASGTPSTGTVYIFNEETDSYDSYAYTAATGTTVTLSGTLSQTYEVDAEIRFEGQIKLEVDGQYWVSFRSTNGGGVRAYGEAPLRTLGNVVRYALDRSGEKLDELRSAAEVARLSAFKIDTLIIGRTDLAAWVDSQLASVFPISRVSGPDGVYYKFMNYLATERDASLHFDLDRGDSSTLVGPIFVDTSEVANRFAMEYAPSQMSGSTKRVQIGHAFQGSTGDSRIRRNEHCLISYHRYARGRVVEASPIRTPHVFSDSTAYLALAHRAARSAFPVISLQVECWDVPCVEIGTIVLVSLDRMGWTKHPAIVVSVTLGGPWQRLGLELLRSKSLT